MNDAPTLVIAAEAAIQGQSWPPGHRHGAGQRPFPPQARGGPMVPPRRRGDGDCGVGGNDSEKGRGCSLSGSDRLRGGCRFRCVGLDVRVNLHLAV